MVTISVWDFIFTVFLLLVCIAAAIGPVYLYALSDYRYRKRDYEQSLADRPDSTYWQDRLKNLRLEWSDGWDTVSDHWWAGVLLVVSTIAGVIVAAVLLFDCIVLVDNKINESTHYVEVVAEGQSLQEIADHTLDIVNQDIYMKIVEYNTGLAKIQHRYNRNGWKWNFSGDCDWTAIPRVEVKKPSFDY